MLGEVCGGPKLFGDHAADISEVFHCLDERHWIPPGGELVMAALTRQDRPCPPDAGPVIGAAVILLPVPIVIVAAPAWTLRQISLDDTVNDLYRIAYYRIVRIANAQPDKMKEISADYVSCQIGAAAVGNRDHCRIRIRMWIGCLGICWGHSDVMARKPFN